MPPPKLVIGTRLHLGNASVPPSSQQIEGWIRNLQTMVDETAGNDLGVVAVIAVDATPKIPEYDYVQVLRQHISGDRTLESIIHILPVSPWGKFVPALNALVLYAHEDLQADHILMVSAEVSASSASIHTLYNHCKEEIEGDESYVLVAGAALNGHTYQVPNVENDQRQLLIPLNGRTCPWNTLAMWNLSKLILTGFLSVSDIGSSAGIEECAAVAIHQHLFPHARSKLVALSDVKWNEQFDDEERKKWHERKMNSKLERSEIQLKLLGLENIGRVEHC
jgi:hypothetical protein